LREVAEDEARVFFRAPSPRTVGEGGPVLAVGPAKGLRVRLRLPKWQRKALEQAADVKLELVSQLDRDGNVETHFVERWFSGRLLGWHDLEKDPSRGLAELSCNPPHEAVRCLVSGNEVLAKMHWSAPLLTNPLFAIGAILCSCGTGAWALAAWRRRRFAGLAEESRAEPLDDPSRSGPSMTEYGSEGAMLHVLGGQLREAVSRREVDRHLLAALEWALDRHRARAVRLIALGLGEVDQLLEHLQEIICRNGSANGNGSRDVLSRQDRYRLLRIIKTVAPIGLATQAEELEQELDKGNGEAEAHFDLLARGRSLPR